MHTAFDSTLRLHTAFNSTLYLQLFNSRICRNVQEKGVTTKGLTLAGRLVNRTSRIGVAVIAALGISRLATRATVKGSLVAVVALGAIKRPSDNSD